MKTQSEARKLVSLISPLFPVIVAAVSFLLLKIGYASEFCLLMMLVSFVCITGIPFYYACLDLARRDAWAKYAVVIVPVAIWVLYAVLRIAFHSTFIASTLRSSLTLLACIAVNLLPVWICAAFCTPDSAEGTGHGRLFYWTWPAVIPAVYAAATAIGGRMVPVLAASLVLSFVIYFVLFLVRRLRRSS